MSYELEQFSREVLSSKIHEAETILLSEGKAGLEKFFSSEKNKILNAPYMIRVMNLTGDSVYLKPSVQEKKFDFSSLKKKVSDPGRLVGWSSFAAIDDEDRFEILTEKVGDQFYLQVGRSNENHEDVLDKMLTVFIVTGSIFVFLSALFGLWYARRSLAPLRDVLLTIKKIESGDLSNRVEVLGPHDELRDLGETFNRMIARIEKLILIMRESLDNVAHDIRIPLTRIRAVAEDALTSQSPTPLKEALQDCAENASEVSELVDQLMSISEAEAGTLSLQYSDCHVQTLLQDIVDIYEFVAQEKSIQLSVICDSDFRAVLDRKRIKQVIGNLVDNAIKFSPDQTQIQIEAKSEGASLRVEVRDQGSGVSDADLARLWDRLYRGDKSRTTKGSGLGLSIVRSIVMAHGGQVDAKSGAQGGMVFYFLIPMMQKTHVF
jgi:signal transduction histidine kinase